MGLAEDRARARGLATRIVAWALAIVGITFVVLGVVLTVRGGVVFLFVSLLLGIFGLALAGVGFFFQLVPFRLEELAREHRDYDVRQAAQPGRHDRP